MKVIIKGRLSEEYLDFIAPKVLAIFESSLPVDAESITIREANHQRIAAMVDELGIVGYEVRKAMYDQIVNREEGEKLLQMWIEGYWSGERVVCDLDKLDHYDSNERIKRLFYQK